MFGSLHKGAGGKSVRPGESVYTDIAGLLLSLASSARK